MRKGWLVGGTIALGVIGGVTSLIPAAHRRPATARQRGDAAAPTDLTGRLRVADPAMGASLFGPCAACHSVGRGGADLDGPNLYGVTGNPVAERRSRFAYSVALRRMGGVWSFARLDAWLTSPAAFAPGTSMTFAGLADPQDRADVIAFLNTQGSRLPLP